MNRLIEKTVFCELVTACRFAACPIKRSPLFAKATIEGVVRAPSEFSMTTGSPPSITAIQELVVPRSMPKILAIRQADSVRIWRARRQTRYRLGRNYLITNRLQDLVQISRILYSASMAHMAR